MQLKEVCMDPNSNANYSFMYCPSLPAAILFSVLFGLTTLVHVVQAIMYRKAFCWVLIMAGAWETAGLVLRVFNVVATTSLAFGLPSQLLILLAPLWVNAFLYMLMARFVHFYMPEKKIAGVSARRLSLIFVLLDITAFLMQATGGSMISGSDPSSALLGIHIYMGGIGLQEIFVLGFTGLVIRFHIVMKRLTDGGMTSASWKWPLYLTYMSLSLITIRIIYRLVEFSSGLDSPITEHEAFFYVLDALPMLSVIFAWNAVHPGRVLVGPDSDFPKKIKMSRAQKKAAREAKKQAQSPDLEFGFGKQAESATQLMPAAQPLGWSGESV
ncbi:unnamed protein product [Mycena citricolor]|uniref:RTA1 domain protein n=1 Tax=Mycena citricolor TaxID=2018698 RepID=A0AAD2H933_9AGAR|nr:unnamed protein product [Mycena citricolor]